MRILIRVLFGFLLATPPTTGFSVVDEDCGNPYDSQGGGGGPHDYRDPAKREIISIVEKAHFTRYMEEVAVHGTSSVRATRKEEQTGGRELIAGNLDYTLRAIPNHPRALYAMAMWQLKIRRASQVQYLETRTQWGFRSAECYFERGVMFQPRDGMVHFVYGIYLHKAGELDEAERRYRQALDFLPDSPEAHYNVGLLYVDQKRYELAREHAVRAYQLGYPLDGLRRALAEAGMWNNELATSGDDDAPQ